MAAGRLPALSARWGPRSAILRSFAAGRITSPHGPTGGVVAKLDPPATVTQTYWDKATTGQSTSLAGTRLSTTQLKAALPAGLATARWGITENVSYPFLLNPTIFRSTLATTVKADRIFTFLPIRQFDRAEYSKPAPHANRASEAAVYTMLARAIGITKNLPRMTAIRIDTTYWHDSTQTTTFNGAITAHATRGPVIELAAATPISAANILRYLNANRVVLISGPTAQGTHYMLATSYQTDGTGKVIGLIADDPYTGQQVRIHPTTKKLVAPAGFRLSTFKVTSFRVITLL